MKKYTCPLIRVLELCNDVVLAGSVDGNEIKIDVGNVDADKHTNPWNNAASKEQGSIWDGEWL